MNPVKGFVIVSVMLLAWAAGAAEPGGGWTRAELEIFLNAPVGSRLVPFAWFAALEEAGGESLLAREERLAAFGFIPAVAGGANPGGLPVGLARERDRRDGAWLGLSCAACHVRAGSGAGMVPGAGSALDAGAFLRALAASVAETGRDAGKFGRFAARMAVAEEAREALRARVVQVGEALVPWAEREAGPGRIGVAGAAERFPAIWGAGEVRAEWLQAHAAAFSGPTVASPVDLLPVRALLRRLSAPERAVDAELAGRGRAVFAQGCAGCHAAPGVTVGVEAVGTDPALARAAGWAGYRARPLAAVGAAGPLLHNGSVPGPAELLMPAAARPRRFAVGAGVAFDAAGPGDGNGGHEYGTGLPEEAKRALLEFLAAP